MAKLAGQIRSVVIPVTGERVLLPNATVAEVITYSTPDPVPDAPEWLPGRVVWRGWRVPVFSLAMLGDWAERESEAGAKLAILKAFGGNKDMPFIAMVTQGFPRLVTVDADSLEVMEHGGAGAADPEAGAESEGSLDAAGFNAVTAVVNLNGERAVIPNLTAIEQRVLEALKIAA